MDEQLESKAQVSSKSQVNEVVEKSVMPRGDMSAEEKELLGLVGQFDEKEKQTEAERQKAIAAQIAADKRQKQATSVSLVTQFHPCSFCGGQKVKVFKDVEAPRVVIGMKIPQPSKEGNAKPLIVCHKCQLKVFTTPLGRASYYGLEMEHLTGIKENKGYFPARADGKM